MTERSLNLRGKSGDIEKITNLYVTDYDISFRILQIIDNVGEQTVHTRDELLSHTVFEKSAVFKINESYYNLIMDLHYSIDELRAVDWVCGAYIRLFVPSTRQFSDVRVDNLLPVNIWGYNTRANSYISKRDDTAQRKIITNESYADAVIKFKPRTRTDTFLTAPMQVLVESEDRLITNLTFTQTLSIHDPDTFWDAHTLKVELSGSNTIEADGWVDLTVKTYYNNELFECGETFIVEAVDGYAPHKRVTLNKGIGTFRVRALDLQSGEQMRVKINSKFETGLAEHTMDVI